MTDSSKDLDIKDGKVINRTGVNGKGQTGIAVDNNDNVYICFIESAEVSVWSPDFSHSRQSLQWEQPINIVYSNATHQLH